MQSEKTGKFENNPLMRAALLHEQVFPSATLYIVGLPIGNAADMTLRALWTLALSDAIACEDTRETRKLLDRYAISTPCVAVHEHNEREAAQKLIERLRTGDRIALVTDAGTPAVSDPGARVVQSVRDAGFRVIPVPGASAVITAMSAAGLNAYRFTFAGFVDPAGKARKEAVFSLAKRGEAFILYEAPHRIQDLLEILSCELEANRRVVIAREITKKFEEVTALTAQDLPTWASTHDPKGEYVILVDERTHDTKEEERPDEVTLRWARLIAKELPVSRAAAIAAKASGVHRDAIYKALLTKEEKN